MVSSNGNTDPAVYPHFSLYPSAAGEVSVNRPRETQEAAPVFHYPYLEICEYFLAEILSSTSSSTHR
jgi:hypothetical protein